VLNTGRIPVNFDDFKEALLEVRVFVFKALVSILVLISTMAFALPTNKAVKLLRAKPRIQTTLEKAHLEIAKIPKSSKRIPQKNTPLPTLNNSSPPLYPSLNHNGIFTVQGPELKIVKRQWQYLLGFKIQPFQPKGYLHSDIVGDFNLASYEAQILPSLELGISKTLPNPWGWNRWTALAQVGYNSVSVPLIFPSGFSTSANTRLNSLLASLGWLTSRAISAQPSSSLTAGLGVGKLYYTQTSYNDLAQFSESLYYGSANFGATHQWTEALEVSANYLRYFELQSRTLKIQSDNFDLGVRFRW
jgi:hypothetical protein